ncbi:MAG: hypothetical protein C0489_11615 [Candidatus Accumulibacter sp.]|nr:hypothetical protein [Accumulibacter sp.]
MSDNTDDAFVGPGDLCRHRDNSYPIYEVLCVDGERAWLRDVSSGVEGIVSRRNCIALDSGQAARLDGDLRRAAQLEPSPPHSRLTHRPRW